MSYQSGTYTITTTASPQTINVDAIDGVQMLSLRFTSGTGSLFCPANLGSISASAISIVDATPITILGVNNSALDGVIIIVDASSTCEIITTP